MKHRVTRFDDATHDPCDCTAADAPAAPAAAKPPAVPPAPPPNRRVPPDERSQTLPHPARRPGVPLAVSVLAAAAGASCIAYVLCQSATRVELPAATAATAVITAQPHSLLAQAIIGPLGNIAGIGGIAVGSLAALRNRIVEAIPVLIAGMLLLKAEPLIDSLAIDGAPSVAIAWHLTPDHRALLCAGGVMIAAAMLMLATERRRRTVRGGNRGD